MFSPEPHTSRQWILEEVKRFVLGHLSDQPAKVYLFGSWARGEEKRSSDIDVAVEFLDDETYNRQALTNLRFALEESTIPYKVEIVDLRTADEPLVNRVKKEGILWAEQKSD